MYSGNNGYKITTASLDWPFRQKHSYIQYVSKYIQSSRWNKRHLVRDSGPGKVLCWPHRCTSDPERDETQTERSKALSTSPTITQHAFPADVRCIHINRVPNSNYWMPFYREREISSHKRVFIHLQESPSSDRWTSLLS